MFNIQPGGGLGGIGSREIAFSLGTPWVTLDYVLSIKRFFTVQHEDRISKLLFEDRINDILFEDRLLEMDDEYRYLLVDDEIRILLLKDK